MNISTLLTQHRLRYPLMQAQDVYKLIHQAACGPAHALLKPEDARAWLQTELENLSDPYPEPTIDPINTDTGLVRVHLAAYISDGGDPEMLLRAFIVTCQHYQPDQAQLESWLKQALQHMPGLTDLFPSLEASGFPARHHSETYRKAYRPAYRVLLEQSL